MAEKALESALERAVVNRDERKGLKERLSLVRRLLLKKKGGINDGINFP